MNVCQQFILHNINTLQIVECLSTLFISYNLRTINYSL